jgi:Na+/melibiose symporter-like transporter
MSLGLILVIILVIFLLGGFSGRFGGYGYGYGNGGIGVIGIILIVLVVLVAHGPDLNGQSVRSNAIVIDQGTTEIVQAASHSSEAARIS